MDPNMHAGSYAKNMAMKLEYTETLPLFKLGDPLNGKIYFTLPSFHVKLGCPPLSRDNEENFSRTKIIENLRVIQPETLIELIKAMEQVPRMTILEISERFAHLLTELKDDNTKAIISFVNRVGNHMINSTPNCQKFFNLNSFGTSFDIIREYVFEQGIFKEAVVRQYGRYQLYSQIHDLNLVKKIKLQMNDNEVSRALYSLKQIEKTIALEPNYIPHTTHELTILLVYLVVLTISSHTVAGEGSDNLTSHYLAYMIDAFVRTVVIDMWQKHPTTKRMLQDITTNFDNSAIIPKLCALTTPEERAEVVIELFVNHNIELMKNQPIRKLFPRYMEVFYKRCIKYEDETYVHLNTDFVSELIVHLELDPNDLLDMFEREIGKVVPGIDKTNESGSGNSIAQFLNNMNIEEAMEGGPITNKRTNEHTFEKPSKLRRSNGVEAMDVDN